MDSGSVSRLIYCLSCVFPLLHKLSLTDRNSEDFFGNFFEGRGKPPRFKSTVNSFVRFCSQLLLSLFSRKPPFYLEGSFSTEEDHAWVAAPVQWAYLHRTDGSARVWYLARAQPPPGAGSVPPAKPCQPLTTSLGLSAGLWRCTPCCGMCCAGKMSPALGQTEIAREESSSASSLHILALWLRTLDNNRILSSTKWIRSLSSLWQLDVSA